MFNEKTPLVSIIIVNYNGKYLLKNCLDSIKHNNYNNYEIFLVDNNSSDDSIEFTRFNYPEVKIIKLEKNYGFAEPNNIAAKQASGELLFFLNNDTIITNNTISELVKFIQHSDVSICQSLLLNTDGTIDSSGDYMMVNGISYNSKKKIKSVKPILSARGAAMIIRKDIFWRLDGFDTKFFASFEDVDLGWRAWISGFTVVLVPSSIVYHLGGQTTKNLESIIKFHGAKNTMLLCLVNFEFFYSIKSLISLFKLVFQKKISSKSTRKSNLLFGTPSIKLIFCVIFWLVKNFNYIIQKRSSIRDKRILSTNELIQKGLIKISLNEGIEEEN